MTSDEAREIAIQVCRGYGYAEAAAVLEAQANVEEKKAAFLEAAREVCETFMPEDEADVWRPSLHRMVEAWCALVEAEKESAEPELNAKSLQWYAIRLAAREKRMREVAEHLLDYGMDSDWATMAAKLLEGLGAE